MNTILFLPKTARDEFITIEGLTLEQAKGFINVETTRMIKSMKIAWIHTEIKDQIHTDPNSVNHFSILSFPQLDIVDNDADDYISTHVTDWRLSATPKTRGNRAVFIDNDKSVILIGTTIIYNHNWITVGYEDENLLDSITRELLELVE